MMDGKMMAGVRRTPPPPLKLELEETGAVLRKWKVEEMEEMNLREEEVETNLREEEVETTSAGTAVRLVFSKPNFPPRILIPSI